MAETFNEPFDTGPDGATVSTSNTTYDNVVPGGSGTAVFDDAQSVAGGMSCLLATTAAGDSITLQDDFTSRSLDHRSWYVRIPSLPPDHSTLSFVTTGSVAALLEIMSTGTCRIRDGFSAVDTATTALALDTWHRIDWRVDASGSTQEARCFYGANLHGSTPDETLSGAYTGGAYTGFRTGITADVGDAWSMWLDEARGDDADYPAPAVTNTPPTADAGPDQTVDEGATVHLDGTGSADPEDAAVDLTYAWTVTNDGGTGLTTGDLTGASTSTPSFTAPSVSSAASIVIQLEVTDTGGLSDTDTVTVTVEPVVAAFPAVPLDALFELELDSVWTDITDFVYTRDPVTISRGQSDEGSRTDPSRLSFTVDNTDGRFSPRNPNGAYFGKIGRNTSVRVGVRRGDRALLVPGSSDDDRVDTPDSASLSVTGDIDVRIDATTRTWSPEWNETGFYGLASKWAFPSGQSWAVYVDSFNFLNLAWTTDGTDATETDIESTEAIPLQPGRQALRVTLDVDNGSGGHDVTFYTADTIDGPWTQLGDVITISGTTSIFDSTADVEVGGLTGLGVDAFAGRIHAFELLDGIAGTTVADPDFSVPAEGATSFTDTAGNTWTVQLAAEITSKRYRFHGEISAWPVRWDPSENDVYVPLEAAGILRRLGAGAAALKSAIRRELTATGRVDPFTGNTISLPVAYWPMEDPEHADAAASALQNGIPMTIIGAPRLANDTTFVASGALPTLNGATFRGRVPRHDDSSEAWQVRCLLSIPRDGTTNDGVLMSVRTTGTVDRWDLVYETGGDLRILGYTAGAATASEDSGTEAFTLDGGPARVSLEVRQDGADVDFTVVVHEVGHFAGQFGGGTATSSTAGRVTHVIVNPEGDHDDVVLGHVSVHAEITSIFDLESLTGHSGENAIERVARLADEEGFTAEVIGADAAPWLGPQTPAQLVDLLRLAATSTSGILYESRDRLAVGLRTRTSLYRQDATVALDYASQQVSPPLEPTDDDQRTINDVTVSAQAGSSARIVLTDGPLSILDPPDGVGRYDEDVTVSSHHAGFLPHMAGWRVRLGTVDETRYPRVTVNLARDDVIDDAGLVDSVLFADVGDRLTIDNPPSWLPPEDISQIVIGYTETFADFVHRVEFVCAPESPYQVAEFDLDSDTSPRYAPSDSRLGFPFVQQTRATTFPTSTTSHLVAMPSTVNADDVLIVVFVAFVNTPGFQAPTGWTEKFVGTGGGSMAIFATVADGTEDGTDIDFVTTTATTAAVMTVRVEGAFTDVDDGIEVSTGASGTSTTPDPDEVTAPWGATANLYIAAAGWVDDDVAVSSYPVGYSGGVEADSGAGANAGAAVGVAHRLSDAPSEDPGAFTLASQESWHAATIAVRPAAVAVDSTEDSWNVFTVSGPLWTTDISEEFDIMVGGGERVNVFIVDGTSSPQTFLVNRSINGVVKSHPPGTKIELFKPAYRAL